MEKKIVDLPVEMPLVTEDDLFNNEMVWFVLIMASRVLCIKRLKTEEELRIIKVYSIISKIRSCYTCINQAGKFIKRRPTIKELDSNEEMTVIDYYNYHYDVIIHKLSTIRDLSFKLINIIFDLKLEDKDCTWYQIQRKKNLITIPGVLDFQYLYYNMMQKIELERNESTHNGPIENRIFKDIDGLVNLSQWRRLEKVPEEVIGPDPMAKGTYYETLLRERKKELLKNINVYKTASLFCTHVLTCCMSKKFKSDISQDLLDKYSTYIKKAYHHIDTYERKINKLSHLIPYLISNNEVIEYLKSHDKKNDKRHYRLIVSLVNV